MQRCADSTRSAAALLGAGLLHIAVVQFAGGQLSDPQLAPAQSSLVSLEFESGILLPLLTDRVAVRTSPVEAAPMSAPATTASVPGSSGSQQATLPPVGAAPKSSAGSRRQDTSLFESIRTLVSDKGADWGSVFGDGDEIGGLLDGLPEGWASDDVAGSGTSSSGGKKGPVLAHQAQLLSGVSCSDLFPYAAHVAHAWVNLEVDVTEDGVPHHLHIMSATPAHEGFEAAARLCMTRMHFKPATDIEGHAMQGHATIRLQFDRS